MLAGEPVNLLETLAQRLADVCLAYPLVDAVEITVHKPQAELGVPFDDVTVSHPAGAGMTRAVLSLGRQPRRPRRRAAHGHHRA